MSELVSIGTVVLAGLVHASLQLGLGCMLLLYHESAGRHIRKKTRGIINFYIFGIGVIVFLLLAAGCFVVTQVFGGALSTGALTAVIGILVALALVAWTLYYRRGKTTELWLPKIISKFVNSRARVTDNNTEAFSLGVLTAFAELPFALILLIVAGNAILELPGWHQILLVVLYTLITLVPPIVMRIAIKNGNSVVSIQKWRVRNKLFLKIVSGIGFLLLAVYIFAFKVIGGA